MPLKSPYPPLIIPKTDLFDFIFNRPDKHFLSDKVIFRDAATKRCYTHNELLAAATKFARVLQSRWSWRKGNVLAIYSPNSIDTPIVTWGALLAGASVSPANPAYTAEELASQLKDCGAKLLVTQLSLIDKARSAAHRAGLTDQQVILIDDHHDAEHRFAHFGDFQISAPQVDFNKPEINAASDVAFIVYSSGTTGLPKGIMLTHTNVVANVLMLSAGFDQFTEDDRILIVIPIFHIAGLSAITRFGLYTGCEVVIQSQFNIERFCAAIQAHKITMSFVAPPIVLALANSLIVDRFDITSLRFLNSAAAPLSADTILSFYRRFKVPVVQTLGISETGPGISSLRLANWRTHIGSVGLLLPNQEMKIVNADTGTEVEDGSVGEIWVKGPNIFKGYLHNDDATSQAMSADGYFKTGDIGFIDPEGNLYITDRLKELIKYKGFGVAPAELEAILLTHPQIDDVAVIRSPALDDAGEVPRAYVVRSPAEDGASLPSEYDITEWFAGKVAYFKRLRGGVRFVDTVPKSASGKILRRVLYAQEEAERKSATSAKL